MKHQEFESICRQAQAEPVLREDHPNGVIVIADGMSLANDDSRYRTVWAFGRDDETLEIGRPLLFNSFYEDKGVTRPVTKEIRVAAALDDARQFAESRRG